ncbi:hypothetical protein Ae201684P_001546 [Aphanomyces euteiches]|nr:hypothetical protein Ae201684P_001546 [Aphanomyces euteiches]KAH9138952.1 hypothetical protein AeRB84_016748 [Aphanomyces euteiches]
MALETFLRCAVGWRVIPPVLDHIASCSPNLLEELIVRAFDAPKTFNDLLGRDASLLLTTEQMRNATAGLQLIFEGLKRQKLTYPSSSTPQETEQAWEATLRQLQTALGPIPHRDAISWALLKQWKRQVKQNQQQEQECANSSTSFAELDWKVGVVVARSSDVDNSPNVYVRLKWTLESGEACVLDLSPSEFHEMHEAFRSIAISMGD